MFQFLANVQDVQQEEGSPVLALDLTTAGPPRLGSRYREVVQMLPFFKGEILSEITALEPPRILEVAWTGPGMKGTDRYELTPTQGGTSLKHTKYTVCLGFLRVMEPFMRGALIPRLEERLVGIKGKLEERSSP